MDDNVQDICRVCRSEGSSDKPLYHPCICTGSIKYIHQDCLVQWLKYSEKEYCELCNYRFSFIPIYSPDMPKRLPIHDIVTGLLGSLATAVKYWIHYSIVAIAWLGIVPLTAYRIYRCLFAGSWSSVLSLPSDLLSTENIATDGFYGCCLISCTLCAFLSLVWLREQIVRGGGPEWLEPPAEVFPPPRNVPNRPQNIPDEPGIGLNNNVNNNNVGENAEESEGEEEPHEEDNLRAVEAAIEAANDVAPLLGDPDADVGEDADPARIAAQEEINWNPVEWDRAAEDLTWERILGLDGSLIFFEHVFWAISLNTLFVLIFAFFPFHVGALAVKSLGLLDTVSATNFEGLVTTLFGYIIISIALVVLHSIAALLRFRKTQKLLGLSYVAVKVALLFVFEIGVFPLVFGWWFDICSLPILGATLSDRETGLRTAPGTSMFIHWLVGMVYVFYFASFMYILREVLRPGALWFLRNLNDPDFNPIQDMINLSVFRHIRKFVASLVIFGTTVLLLVWFPVCIIQKFLPGFLPYHVFHSSSNENQANDISLEFLILQLILPALLDHTHLRSWLKSFIRTWCVCVSYILDIRSFLLGDVNPGLTDGSDNSLVQVRNDENNQPYIVPKYFALRIICLLLCVALSLLFSGLFFLTIPVIIGRRLFSVWLGETRVHELNTAACGLYIGLLLARACAVLCNWVPRGWNAIAHKIREGFIIAFKAFVAGTILLGIIPLLIGLIFDVVIIIPIRVPLNQSPIFYLWQDWAFGILHTKAICGLAMMADWRLREILEALYQGGLMNINLQYIMTRLAIPVILILGSILSLPYFIIFGILPIFGVTFETRNLFIRRIYPFLLIALVLIYVIHWQINKFCRLYEHIKNDKYLVGKRLVNYDPSKNKKIGASSSSNSSAAVN